MALLNKEEIEKANDRAQSNMTHVSEKMKPFPIKFGQENFKVEYKDEYTGSVLPMHLVRAAMIDELSYLNENVWRVCSTKDAAQDADAKIIRTRWVLCNKGDDLEPDVRARLVACEVNHGDDAGGAFYASTPPLECKRMLFSDVATRKLGKTGKALKLSFVDIRKAYFNGIPKRKMFLHFPKELGMEKGLVGLMVRCAYGTRDAGAIWEDTFSAALMDLGFKRGVVSPC